MSEPTTTRPGKQWLHVGDELRTLGAATVRVVKTRAGECRLEVETDEIFEWSIRKNIDQPKPAS